ncbi:MAG: integrase/recombinase XerD [Granulosicoccus sp.]|jgi:integrase/recombinase XerD
MPNEIEIKSEIKNESKFDISENPQTFEISNPENENFSIAEISEEEMWLENFTSKATQKTYKDGLKKFCQILGIENVESFREVNSRHIIIFREKMREMKASNATINNRLSGLSSLFKHLIEKQIIKTNPVYGVKAMKKNYRKVKSRALSNAEVDEILKQPNPEKLIGLRDKAILSIMFNVGTRRGTLTALTGKDIYEEDGYLIIDMHLKGDKRNRVAANSHIQASLKNYFEAMGYYVKDSSENIKFKVPEDAPIFPQMSNNPKMRDLNKPMTTTSIYQMWQKYTQKAGIERTNPHCARATFITKALKAGCDLQHVQHTAGHTDPRTTMSYNHNEVEHKNSASFAVSFG